jgi:hypothetical protein
VFTIEETFGVWRVQLAVTGEAGAVAVDSAGQITLVGGESLELHLTITHSGPNEAPTLLIGGPTQTHLLIDKVSLSASASFTATDYDLGISLQAHDAELLIHPEGFLAELLSGTELRAVLDSKLEWTRAEGIRFSGASATGGAGFSITVPIGLTVGPISVPQLTLELNFDPDGLTLQITGSVTAALGPFAAALDRLGVSGHIARPSEAVAGPVDFKFAPALPTGIGLTIDADVVSGGGYLSLDPKAGQYAGAIQLEVAGIGLSAVGLLTTRLPDGSPGFSLLVLISVELPPIQLGFGFALTGVGGLLGVNRGVKLDALQAGLQAGALDRILFPADVVANAPRIVADLGRFFPIALDQFVLGPTVRITWGSEAEILTATLGIFIEFPSPTRVLLAGSFHLALPTPKAPVVDVRLDVLGSLDFTRKELAIDAVLRDSRVAAFTLTGQAAVRASWGDEPAFLLAAGGFHPRFQPPATFPRLERLTLALGTSDNPRLRLEAYFALTSNTVQFGARLELYAAADALIGTFAVAATLSFDALFQFDPFAFVVEIHASVSLELNNEPILGISLELMLSGPQPWHAVGTATFHFLGSHSIQFEITTGESTEEDAAPTLSLASLLITELKKSSSWSAELPAGGRALAVLRQLPASDGTLAVHPLGALTVRQRVAPLGVAITHLGASRLTDPDSFGITGTSLGASTLSTKVSDYFARAQYLDLSDADKLVAPSFEPMVAGARLGSPAPLAPDGAAWANWTVPTDYETRILTRAAPGLASTVAPPYRMPASRVLGQLGGAAAAQCGQGSRGADRYAGSPVGVAVVDPTYAVAGRADLSPAVAAANGMALAPAADALAGIRPALTYLRTYTEAAQRLTGVSAAAGSAGGMQVVATQDVLAAPILDADPDIDTDGHYVITALHSNKCLQVQGASKSVLAPVEQWGYVGATNQHWQLTALGGGFYRITAVHSGFVLQVAGGAQDQQLNGAKIVQAPWWENDYSQQWQLTQVVPGYYQLQNLNSGKCLDVEGGPVAVADGAAAQQWDWYGGDNQKWRLTKVPSLRLLRQQIRDRAYALYLDRGQRPGHAVEDWLQAQREVLRPLIAARAYAYYQQRGRGWGHAVDDWVRAERELVAEVVGGAR